MRHVLILLAVLLVAADAPPPPDPASAVRPALADAQTLTPDRRVQAGYLSAYHIHDKDKLDLLDKVLRFVPNALSHEVELKVPVRVAANPWRVYRDDYGGGWDKAWPELLEAEPYFNVNALLPQTRTVKVTELVEYGNWWLDGRAIPERRPGAVWQVAYKRPKIVEKVVKADLKQQKAAAPWLDPKEISGLINLTQNRVPIYRADRFVWQVMAQEGRGKAGYYDFNAFPEDEAKFFALAAVRKEDAARLKRELRANFGRSGVAHNSREVEWYDGILPAFRSNDFDRSTDVKNALRLVGGDAIGDAHEYFVRAPNRLWWVYLANKELKRVNFAPDNIASDKKCRGTDSRIHVGINCFGCHKLGLQPINNWAKTIYSAPFSLDSPDPDRQRRLRTIYLRDMMAVIEKENEDYAAVIKGLNGLEPAANAEALAEVYHGFELDDLDMEATAREVGLTVEDWTAKLKVAARGEKKLDEVLAALHQGYSIRRDHWEEVFASAMAIAHNGGEPWPRK